MSSIINAAQTTLSQNLGGIAHQAAPAGARFTLDDVPDQSGKVAVVTGGSEGIGYGIVHTLLSKNISKVFILSLSPDVIDQSIAAIKEEMGQATADKMNWLQCDMGDWNKIPGIARQITEGTDRLDILINNAARGIMTYQETELGVDRHMAVNHIGPTILTSHLLSLLKKTAEQGHTVRISNQASNAHEMSPKDLKFASLDELNQDVGPMPLYGRSKLATILYSRYLTRHLNSQYPKILINATHPGVVETTMSTRDILEPYPMAGHLMKDAMKPFKKDQFEGALSML